MNAKEFIREGEGELCNFMKEEDLAKKKKKKRLYQ
jgi:hypothetical protein